VVPAKVLCVDDDPYVVAALASSLRRKFAVVTATSGAEALAIMDRETDLAVVVSDMRMPGMDGAAFLARARAQHPDVVRILLTGYADIESAISAVNDGQIFRFMAKPCPNESLCSAVAAAVRQHELVHAEHVLLEQTLRGAVETLIDTLELANPALFGRANRVRRLAAEIAGASGIAMSWQLDVAALLARLGSIALPDTTCEKLDRGHVLSDLERMQVKRVPAITERLLAHIPRLDDVRAIIAMHQHPPASARTTVERAAQILHLAVEVDALEAADCHDPLEIVRGRDDCNHALVDALAIARRMSGPLMTVREITVGELRPDMVFAADVRLATGALLVPRSYEVTIGFLERIHNYDAGAIREPLLIFG
jgi:CheY-like chemotaxis protein